MNSETLRSWVRRHQDKRRPGQADISLDERAELKELRRRNRELERELIPDKIRSVLREGSPATSKYEFIETMTDRHR